MMENWEYTPGVALGHLRPLTGRTICGLLKEGRERKRGEAREKAREKEEEKGNHCTINIEISDVRVVEWVSKRRVHDCMHHSQRSNEYKGKIQHI